MSDRGEQYADGGFGGGDKIHYPSTERKAAIDREWKTKPHILTYIVDPTDDELRGHWQVKCQNHGADRECAVWYEKQGPCECECDACREGVHEDCDEDYIEEVGTKWCKAEPRDECWYEHVMSHVGAEGFAFARRAKWRVYVELRGCSFEEPVDVIPLSAETVLTEH